MQRSFHLAVVVALLAGAAHAADGAGAWPNRPVRFIVPFPPGGGTDFVTRLFAQRLADAWGQQVVVDNRPGAAGNIGTDIVARAQPDGYTLLMATGGHNTNPTLYRRLPYDPLKDFAGVSLLATVPMVLSANTALPATSVRELVALARAQPGRWTYASFGIGATSHIAGELMKHSTGVDLLHVPYKGAGDAMGNLIGGQVHTMFSTPASVVPQFRAGKLRCLGLMAARRPPAAPDLPTFAEQGYPELVLSEWYGVMVPAGTPRAVIDRLHGEFIRILRLPDVAERLVQAQFADPVGTTPAELDRFVSAEIPRLAKVIRAAAIRID